MVPEQWQSTPTLFERARDGGLDAVVIGPPRYASSGFTHAVLRGARYLGAHTVDERVDAAIAWLRSGARGIGYLYVPELDVIAHAKGWSSPEWTDRLEGVDAALARLAASLGAKDAVVVTADHGVIDLPASSLVAVGAELLAGVAHVAGEPRALQLHADTSADIDGLVARWTEREGSRAWVATRDEVQSAGWWGPVSATVAPRLGDVLVIARKAVAYYTHGLDHPMVGHHGALSSAELRVPLIPLGAFGN
jgi:predicted AlkP superfamily pyrophosphatase or phosphodiesterase